MIRSAVLVSIGVAITAFFSFWAVIYSFFDNAENNVHKVARIWSRILLAICGTKVQVIGRENIRPGRPQVLMANHQSDFDILITLAHVPGQFRWIAKKELFAVPVFGQAMRSAGYIEIDRQNHEKALRSLDLAALRIREGKSVMTFRRHEKPRRRNQGLQAWHLLPGHSGGRADRSDQHYRQRRNHAQAVVESEAGENQADHRQTDSRDRIHDGKPA